MGVVKPSRKVRVTVSRPHHAGPSSLNSHTKGRILGIKAIAEENRKADERQAMRVAGLGPESRKALAEMRGEEIQETDSGATLEDAVMEIQDMGREDDHEWEDIVQEDSSFMHAVRDIIGSQWKSRWYKDARTWRHRVDRMDENWRPLIPKLVEAYLRWHGGSPNSCEDHCFDDSPYDFNIDVFDVYTLSPSTHIHRCEDISSPAEALVLNGYLGTTPLSPSLAISFKTLELFRCIRLFKASFSMEACTKLLCHYYKIPLRRHYRNAISNAFEIYLTILRGVRKHISRVLGRDSPDWRVLNACPACTYELQGEPELRWRRMFAMDGNNSLKRIAHVGDRRRGDTRVFEDGDYYLSDEFVNRFAGEVKSRGRRQQDDHASKSTVDEFDNDTSNSENEHEDQEGDPTDGTDEVASCTKNWKAAASEDNKHMWGIFEETGIFASACRHGFILWICDMTRSGELAKYPLAIVAKSINVLEDRSLGHYDIGCGFEDTVKQSSLGPEWQRLLCRIIVNAFHGYTHNYACQTKNHPNVVEGTGLEDGETLERIFSASNSLASVTRYASAYRRRMYIDEYFRQWDDEKYANLSMMIYNNYIQALNIIETESISVAEAMQSLGIQKEDFAQWRAEERRYFETLGQEQLWDVYAMAYVEKLQAWRNIRAQVETSTSLFLNSIPSDYTFVSPANGNVDYHAEASRTQKLETKTRYLEERERALLHDLLAMEVQMNISQRWQPTDAKYIETAKYIVMRTYHRALDNLQRLVIQRLFELHRLNLSQTAYRTRTHIAKSLQARCKAIRNAVKAYNAAALALDPPRPTLDWSKASHYSFLDEFTLLRDTRNDVRDKPWAKPAIREVLKQTLRIEHAHEELVRCNVEARRLYTAILDEKQLFTSVLVRVQEQEPLLYSAVEDFCERRRNVNLRHLARLQKLADHDGFTGDLSYGKRKGTMVSAPSLLSLVSSDGAGVQVADGDESDFEEGDNLDDDVKGDIGGLVDYISNL